MFRQEKDHLPFNEIAHLTGESLRFSVNLRKASNDQKPAKKVAPLPPPAEVKPAPVIDLKRTNDAFAVRETNCVNPQCLQNNQIFLMDFQERMDLLAGIEAAEQALQEQEALLGEAGEQYAAALKLNHELNESFNELGLREVNAKARRYELIREQMKIDPEIRRTENVKAQLEGMQQQPTTSVASEVNFALQKKAPHVCMKHNGVFRLNAEGVHAWTCCNSTERDHDGCIDDQSVGVRSTLPMVKNFFNNQMCINHPLQHGSSLFLENNVKHNLHRSASAEINYDKEASSHNHTSSLFLGRGSNIDYFSVHKPATRVAAMEPYANKSIRSASRCVFGAAIPPPNAHLEVFLSPPKSLAKSRPATAGGPLQRASIAEVFPHLDTKIRKHQVEQRYIGVDHLKPPAPEDPDSPTNHNTTKHYALYSRPYAHTNTNTLGHGYGHGHGLLTQSVHAFERSQTRPFSAHASTASGLNFNASLVSNVSWGNSLVGNEPAAAAPMGQASLAARGMHRMSTTDSQSQVDHGHHGFQRQQGQMSRVPSLDDAPENESASEPDVHSAHSARSAHHSLHASPPPHVMSSHTLPGTKKTTSVTPAGKSLHHKSQAPHYAQPKAHPVGQKTVIGKQRAVPERVRLTGNRPLTSVQAYDLYAT